eukprot:8438606-Alexandrium_andersonii.AAC.1
MQGGLTEDTADWEKKGRLWIRRRVIPRLTAITPDNAMPGGPELQLLDSKREARRRRIASESSGVHVRVGNFNANPQYEFTVH